MSGIPYNRLQTVEFTAKTDNGETVVMETSHYAFVVPCRDCKHYDDGCCYADQWSTASLMPPHRVTPYGFCAWGERKDGDAR